jgi:hypothetical protein
MGQADPRPDTRQSRSGTLRRPPEDLLRAVTERDTAPASITVSNRNPEFVTHSSSERSRITLSAQRVRSSR